MVSSRLFYCDPEEMSPETVFQRPARFALEANPSSNIRLHLEQRSDV
jgi:hypothetical protein